MFLGRYEQNNVHLLNFRGQLLNCGSDYRFVHSVQLYISYARRHQVRPLSNSSVQPSANFSCSAHQSISISRYNFVRRKNSPMCPVLYQLRFDCRHGLCILSSFLLALPVADFLFFSVIPLDSNAGPLCSQAEFLTARPRRCLHDKSQRHLLFSQAIPPPSRNQSQPMAIIKQTNKTDGQQPHTDGQTDGHGQTTNQKCSAAMCFHTCQHSTKTNLQKLELPGTAN